MPKMASRRTYRSLKQHLEPDYSFLKVDDVLCPICRSILIKPVTLPCNHGFCLTCFKGTIENANLVCPLCRIRISSWLRKRKTDSQLINKPLWDAINNKYSQFVKNKLDGNDDNLEEEPRIIISLPGEIGKEFEVQKQRENEEVRKMHEAENKASEELIKKLKDEEDHQKYVIEEKIRSDEEIARRIASELSCNNPSTSKTSLCNNQIVGPMDRFLKKNVGNVTSSIGKEEMSFSKKFVEKEFTCRVLYLDKKRNKFDVPQTCSPIIKKRIQQIQNNFEAEQLNDSFESFEADMRYFKPITKFSVQSNWKTPIKVPCTKGVKGGVIKILPPKGMVNFRYSSESAFTRVTPALPSTQLLYPSEQPYCNNSESFSVNLKRRISNENVLPLSKKKYTKGDTSPILFNCKKTNTSKIIYNKTLSRLPEETIVNCVEDERESPPFYGFDNYKSCTNKTIEYETKNPDKNCIKNLIDEKSSRIEINPNKSTGSIRKNGNLWVENELYQQRLSQEQADLELAKKLQEEYNSYYTRSSRKVGRGSIHRQTTLDKIFTGIYKVK